ncbi:beta-lactamase family protein [Pseudomonas sp. GD03860]|uniref:serine hydrolase domain-containing protein n=1 Tax=Pseudomonas TaxID=286 RepID=UPI002363A6D1|nr:MULTISPECIES: serine hydrolase domain-containing protein [Pseudomonas]MDD2058918.1 beta-lactamase family protein [Pseudomonas putida]MDH0639858.1 beta-lactamase family protein [Pseudomonas sp. GD03860]
MHTSTLSNGRSITPFPQNEPCVPWWSFTKTVLAATALTVVRDGQLVLDAPLPETAYTLRQLLRHEAGLADYSELPEYHAAVANHEPAWPVDEMMQRLDGARLRYSPGAGWRYSNIGFMLVARLIERATDLPLEEAIRRQVLTPLGISTVRFVTERAVLGGEYLGIAPNYDPGWVYHGLLAGPVSQAALFLDQLLVGEILPADLLQEMQATRVLGGPMAGRPWVTPGYALGLMRGEIEGGLTLTGHTGGGPGSVLAVYRSTVGETVACSAVFSTGPDEGRVEALVAEEIRKVVEAAR